MRLVTPLEMMKLEEFANASGCPYERLMENAGKGLAEHISRIAKETECDSVLFLCGNGNNAGDCFIAANILSKQFAITVCMVNGQVRTRTAHIQFSALRNVKVLTDQVDIKCAVSSAQLVVDGIFGIGFRGEFSPFVREVFAAVIQSRCKCIAVDIPSGGNGLNGKITESIPYYLETITFGAPKVGLFLSPLSSYCGTIRLVEIGIPAEAFAQLHYPVSEITSDLVRSMLPSRPANAHKGTFGRLLNIAGSRNMPGAAILSSQAALRSGVGTFCLASDEKICHMLIQNSPEAMMLPLPTDSNGMLSSEALTPILKYAKNCAAVTIGCGLGVSDAIRFLVSNLITKLTCPIILDADGLNAIASSIDILQKAKASVILTPHPGEMSRLMNIPIADIEKDRLAAAKRFATRFPRTIVVLKGAGTIVATSEHASVNTTGNNGMSRGGSGDVLAGMIGSLTAQGIPPESAAQIGVYLHGLAGDCAAVEFSRRAMLPSDLIRQFPLVFGEYEA